MFVQAAGMGLSRGQSNLHAHLPRRSVATWTGRRFAVVLLAHQPAADPTSLAGLHSGKVGMTAFDPLRTVCATLPFRRGEGSDRPQRRSQSTPRSASRRERRRNRGCGDSQVSEARCTIDLSWANRAVS